ncbi:MAG: glycosyltransferase [Candidatus Cloacimonetes bacterium]|nr:glycosyltransferase [Candidatus Cloacimonadota bacterium]
MRDFTDKILIITPLWSGMKPLFIQGKDNHSGMPAFYNAITCLLKRDLDIDMIIVSKEKIIRKHRSFKNLKLFYVPISTNSRFGLIPAVFKLIKLSDKFVRNNNYKFIYGFGNYSAIVGILSIIYKIPNYRRLFGSFFAYKLNTNKPLFAKYKLLLKHPLEYLSWVLPTNGLIVTDDGTEGDIIAKALGVTKNFHFLKNGVNKKQLCRIKPFSESYIQNALSINYNTILGCYSARLEKWKRVERGIKVCKKVNELGLNFHLIILGNGKEKHNLMKLTNHLNINNKVHFLGSVNRSQSLQWVKSSEYFLSFFESSNLGNALIEAMHLGKIILSLNQPCFNNLLINKYNAFLLEESKYLDSANIIMQLEQSNKDKDLIERRITQTANEHFIDWEERNKIDLKILGLTKENNYKPTKKKHKIFMFSSVHQWDDIRIFHKEAISLARRYDIDLHAPANFVFKEEKNIQIFGLPQWEKFSDRKQIRKELWKRIKKSDADIFHFHDPELILMGFYLKLLLKKKVIFDIHENYFVTIKTKKWIPLIIRLSFYFVFNLLSKISENIFDRLIIAEDSYKEIFTKNSVIIKNYPIFVGLQKNSERKIYDLVYLGGINKIRGIFELIEVTKIIREKNDNFKMIVIGTIFKQEGFRDKIFNEIRDNKLEKNILIKEKMPLMDAIKEIRKAKIGIALLHPHKNYLNSFPTKIFEYMMLGLPVLVSNFPLWKRIIDRNNCGLTANPLKPREISRKILFMLSRPEMLRQMSENGKKAVLDKYDWEIEQNKLYKLYNELLKD